MPDEPTVLVPHLVMANGTEPMAAAIRDRLDGVDLRVATDGAATLEHAPDAEVVVTHRLSAELLEAVTGLRRVTRSRPASTTSTSTGWPSAG